MQDISPSNLMVRVGEYHVLNRNEAHPHLDRRIREVISQWRNKVLSDENIKETDVTAGGRSARAGRGVKKYDKHLDHNMKNEPAPEKKTRR